VTSRAAKFAATFAGLYAAHQLADHWVQTDQQANAKGRRDRAGQLACAKHVASYTATTTAVTVALNRSLRLGLGWKAILGGQVVSAVTHYAIDRRYTLAALCDHTGKSGFLKLGVPRRVEAYAKGPDGTRMPVKVVTVDAEGEHPAPFDNPSLGTGGYALDQSWHIGWLFVAALLTAVM
jgi:hypothetical protein